MIILWHPNFDLGEEIIWGRTVLCAGVRAQALPAVSLCISGLQDAAADLAETKVKGQRASPGVPTPPGAHRGALCSLRLGEPRPRSEGRVRARSPPPPGEGSGRAAAAAPEASALGARRADGRGARYAGRAVGCAARDPRRRQRLWHEPRTVRSDPRPPGGGQRAARGGGAGGGAGRAGAGRGNAALPGAGSLPAPCLCARAGPGLSRSLRPRVSAPGALVRGARQRSGVSPRALEVTPRVIAAPCGSRGAAGAGGRGSAT